MNEATFPAGRCIQAMRFIRPAIDCGLLAVGLFLFMHFERISVQHPTRENRPQRIERDLKTQHKLVGSQQTPVSIAQHFSSEPAMWSEFSLWLNKTKMTTGQCRLEMRPDLNTDMNHQPYLMQCGGVSNTSNSNQASESNTPTLFASNVLVTPEKINRTTKKRRNKSEEVADQGDTVTNVKQEPIKVRGWINTPSGRRFFDPASNRWIP